MKGAVFTEFLEMVENKFGAETADQIIENSQLASEGAYTAVGTYDHQELLQLVTQLGKSTATPIPNLVRTFGQHLFGRFACFTHNLSAKLFRPSPSWKALKAWFWDAFNILANRSRFERKICPAAKAPAPVSFLLGGIDP